MAPPFGTDLLYAFHRNITIAVLVFALLHPVALFGASLGRALGWLVPGAAPWEIASGIWATYALVALAITSWLRKRLKLPYEAWRWAHGPLAAAAVLLAIWHAVLAGRLLSRPVVRWLWLVWTLGWVALILRVRVFKPLALRRRPWTVREVRPEPGDSVTLVLEPEGHEGFRFRSGQFVWLTLGDSPLAGREHPFSIASSPLAWPRVELTIKAIGDFTRRALSTRVGERAYLDGPFGTMSIDAFPDADGYVFIAGGSGIVPCMSMLRTLADRGDRRPHLLLYGSGELSRTIFREQLEALSTRLDLRVVHVLEKPPPGWRGEQGYLTQAMLDRWLPHRGRHAYFVCGPGPMMDIAEQALARLGVPFSDLHSERFDLV
jgi:predicted ferric reductase